MGENQPNVEINEPTTPSGEPAIGSGNFSTSIIDDKINDK